MEIRVRTASVIPPFASAADSRARADSVSQSHIRQLREARGIVRMFLMYGGTFEITCTYRYIHLI